MYYIPRRLFSIGATVPIQKPVTSLKAPIPGVPKLCIDCKYFIVPPGTEVKQGICQRFGHIDLVDGSMEYAQAREVRVDLCKGDLYEDREDGNVDA